MPISNHHPIHTQVLIIGAGVTGAGLVRDLTLRGIACILVEQKDVTAGASGANHGLLHSGARYIKSDPASAMECQKENHILKKLAPHCIDACGGLFVAVKGDDEKYIADFPRLCAQSGITTQAIDLADARQMEPALSDKLIAAYAVDDAAIDPFRLTLDNIAQAVDNGAQFFRFTRVTEFTIKQSKMVAVQLVNTRTKKKYTIRADVVINAAGAWADQVAAQAGISIPMIYSKGSLLVTQSRITQRVVNRLRLATDADILVPGGTVSILGTTSVRTETPDDIYPEIEEIDHIVEEGAMMIPALETTRYIRVYCGVRPLVGDESGGDDRKVSRGYALIDHARDHVDNFITITGGKLTTYRFMAEKTADLVCHRLGIDRPCQTGTEPLPASTGGQWTEPGLAPHQWMKKNDPTDLLLCECEMVSQHTVDQIISDMTRLNIAPTLEAIGLRSRVGKGPCQGAFCSQRLTAHLYDRGIFKENEGMVNLHQFLSERWRGQHPLLWDASLIQSQLQEAMHCGLFGLELNDPKGPPDESGPSGAVPDA
jgi:glycerol-3-phosphate dehydrogenase